MHTRQTNVNIFTSYKTWDMLDGYKPSWEMIYDTYWGARYLDDVSAISGNVGKCLRQRCVTSELPT